MSNKEKRKSIESCTIFVSLASLHFNHGGRTGFLAFSTAYAQRRINQSIKPFINLYSRFRANLNAASAGYALIMAYRSFSFICHILTPPQLLIIVYGKIERISLTQSQCNQILLKVDKTNVKVDGCILKVQADINKRV